MRLRPPSQLVQATFVKGSTPAVHNASRWALVRYSYPSLNTGRISPYLGTVYGGFRILICNRLFVQRVRVCLVCSLWVWLANRRESCPASLVVGWPLS